MDIAIFLFSLFTPISVAEFPTMILRGIFVELQERFRRRPVIGVAGNTFLIVAAGAIGLLTGAVILLFNWSVEFSGSWFLGLFSSAKGGDAWSWVLIPLIPAFGGLCVGLLNTHVFRGGSGHGVTEVIMVTRFSRGFIRKRIVLQKLIGASLSIGSGGGGGREGPIVHVGAAVASILSSVLRLSRDHARTLIACGAAAGISGIFNAPIGGVMFVLEVILGDFRVKTFTPVVVASVAATALTRNAYGAFALVHSPPIGAIAAHEYVWFVVLGLCIGIAAAGFTRTVGVVEHVLYKYVRVSASIKPAIGGLAAGICILFLPMLMEHTYDPVNAALDSSYPVWILLVAGIMKPVHAAFTVGSGGTGGLFAPALKSGAMLGSAFGLMLMWLHPGMAASATPYAVAGMGAMLAGTMHAPLTAILMVIEISGDYGIVLPAMLSSVLAVLVAQRLLAASIYTRDLDPSSGRIGSFAYLPLLSSIDVGQLVDRSAPVVPLVLPLRQVLALFEQSESSALLVTDDDGRYRGIIEFEDVRTFITDAASASTLLAADVMLDGVALVHEETTLDVVMKLFDTGGWTALPVVHAESGRPVGILGSHEVHRFYRISVARET